MFATWKNRWLEGGETLGCAALVLGFTVALTGCKQPSAEARFTADYNCEPENTEEISRGRFRVKGCGLEATYACLNESGGFTLSGKPAWSRVTCIREAAPEEPRHYDTPLPLRKGSVAREVEATSGAAGVNAELPLVLGSTPGPWLRLKLKPGDAPSRILVSISSSARQLHWDGCNGFALLVNGVAVPAGVAKRTTQGAVESIRASFAAGTFAPLARKNPTLGAQLCGSTLALPEDELPTLQKFLAIRDELAQSATPAAPAATPAPAAPAATPAPAAPAAQQNADVGARTTIVQP